jgi:hypothetical protein
MNQSTTSIRSITGNSLKRAENWRGFELTENGRGRRACVAWLEAKAANAKGKGDDEATAAIRRGWYLGKETFRDRLLQLLDQVTQPATGNKNRTGVAFREHGKKEVERIVRRSLKSIGLSDRPH